MNEANYTPEQLAIHARIVERALADKHPAERPQFTVLTGPPKSGKAALCHMHYPYVGRREDSTVRIMPGVMEVLPFMRDNPHVLHPEKLPQFRQEYYDVCEQIARAAHAKGCSVLWFEHGESPDPIRRICQAMEGYEKQLAGVLVPEAECLVMDRIQQTKDVVRHMQPERLHRMRGAFAANWSAYNGLFDESRLFLCHPGQRDAGRFEEVARRTRDEKPEILRPQTYKIFQQLAHSGMADPEFRMR